MKKVQILYVALMLCAIASCSSNTSITNKSDSLFRIFVGEKYGFMDESGRIVIEPQFDEAHGRFAEGVCFARIGKKKGLIDRSGNFVIEFPDSVRWVSSFHKGFAHIDYEHRDGIINREGQIKLVSTSFLEGTEIFEDDKNLYFFFEGAHYDNDCFITDTNGVMIGAKCDYLTGFYNGICAVRANGKWGYMNQEGNLIIEMCYDDAQIFTEDGIARVKKDDEQFFIDKEGNKLFCVEQHLTDFHCNRAAVIMNGEKRLVDRTGKNICTIDADSIDGFNPEDGLAVIIRNGQASLIDTMGNKVLSTHYDNIGKFIDGVAPVRKGKKTGFVDSSGNEIICLSFSRNIDELHNKNYHIRAMKSLADETISYFDLQGNLIWKDSPKKQYISLPFKPNKQDCVKYFDARLAELDPIEGIYYVTYKYYYQDRDNPSIVGLNDAESKFYAVIKNDFFEDGYFCQEVGTRMQWVNQFVKIGESNTYAIMNTDEDSNYSSNGRVTIEDFNQFNFKLDQGHNNWYNFFVTYEFVRDYPPLSEIEKVMKAEWTGSGFAIADGYIATNYHVTSGAKSILIKGVSGDMTESYSGYVVASDKDHDISIIKIVDKDFNGFGTIPYSVGKANVEMGDDVFVLGYPMTSTMGEEVKLTEGIISSTSGFKGDDSMYQISAAVQPGNSGGPLFNADGAVIGIVCGKHADAENANYAIKVSHLYSLATTANLGIKMSDNNHINGKRLSKKVKKIKNYVYLIECRSK